MIPGDIAAVQFSGAFQWGKDLAGNLIVVKRSTLSEVAVKTRNGKTYLAYQQLTDSERHELEALKLWGLPEVAAGWLPFPWDYSCNMEQWTVFLDSIPKATIGPAPVEPVEKAGDEPPRMPPGMNGNGVDLEKVELVRPTHARIKLGIEP